MTKPASRGMFLSAFAVCLLLPSPGFLYAADTTVKGTTSNSTAASLEVTNSSDTSLLYVRNDGNVGIGTTTPTAPLQVTTGQVQARFGTSTYTNFASIEVLNDAGTGVFATARNAGQGLTSSAAGDVIIGANTSKNIIFGNTQTGATEYMRITSAGNVGIGTASPSQALDVFGGSGKGRIQFEVSGVNPTIYLIGDPVNGYYPGIDFRPLGSSILGGTISSYSSSGGLYFAPRGGSNWFYTAASNRVGTIHYASSSQTADLQRWVDNNQNVAAGIGPIAASDQRLKFSLYNTLETTPTNYERLSIYADGSSNVFRIESEKAGTGSYRNLSLQAVGGNVGIGTTNPTLGPLQMGSGAYVTAGGVWTNASSRAYKEEITDLSLNEAMQTLKGLTPITYRYKAAKDEKHVGFVAEDVPELVATEDRKGLSPMDIAAVLTKVVQGQQKQIEELKAQIDNLKTEKR